MVKLEFHDPSGALEVTQPHAPRLASLEGKRIGFVSNEQWQAYRMLPMLKEMLEEDFPGVTVLPIDANPVTRASINLDPWPICQKPDNIVLVVAGGGHPTHSYWLQAHSPAVTGRVIRVPETFERLLADADKDLGCGEDVCRV